MIEQAIHEKDMEEVLRNAETILPARLGRLNAYMHIDGWLIRVTYVLESGTLTDPLELTVITVYAEQRS